MSTSRYRMTHHQLSIWIRASAPVVVGSSGSTGAGWTNQHGQKALESPVQTRPARTGYGNVRVSTSKFPQFPSGRMTKLPQEEKRCVTSVAKARTSPKQRMSLTRFTCRYASSPAPDENGRVPCYVGSGSTTGVPRVTTDCSGPRPCDGFWGQSTIV